MTDESTDGNLKSIVSPLYTERPSYGFVPDPITLFDAAKLIASDPAGSRTSHEEVFEGMIRAFWRGEFEAGDESRVFTLQSPCSSSEDTAEIDEHGRAVITDEEDFVRFVERERVFWTREEVLHALVIWDGYVCKDKAAAYADLPCWPLEMWSETSRRMYWDRLCISLGDLARWIAGRGLAIPKFLSRPPCSAPDVDDDEAMLAAMTGRTDEPVKPGDLTPDGRPRIPLLVAVFLLARQLEGKGLSGDEESRLEAAEAMLNGALRRGTVRAYGIWAGQGQFANIDPKYWDQDSVCVLSEGPYLHESERYHHITVERADLLSIDEPARVPDAARSGPVPIETKLAAHHSTPLPAGQIEANSDSASRRVGAFSVQKVARWYTEEYIPSRANDFPPSRDDDVSAAQAFFPGVPRSVIRRLRTAHAPDEWKRGGRRPSK